MTLISWAEPQTRADGPVEFRASCPCGFNVTLYSEVAVDYLADAHATVCEWEAL